MNKKREDDLIAFQRQSSLRFRSLKLLDLAFFHRSATTHHLEQNERLEFLGDSILGFVSAHILYQKYPDSKEGELAKIKSALVSESSLCLIAKDLQLNSLLVLGKGEEQSGGRNKPAILADLFEAIIGAYFLDSGFDQVNLWLSPILEKQLALIESTDLHKDFKSILHEYSQKIYKQGPKYVLISKTGPDHDAYFTMELKLGEEKFGPLSGTSLKETEKKLSELACHSLNL